ncbi:hypothetical protein ACNARK_09175 [Proteus sp. DFP240708]|uniref:hypothetical protein n=1 Tax=Proteus sp. DFP240708 TaxID=3399624 RepID=UPI003A4D91A1
MANEFYPSRMVIRREECPPTMDGNAVGSYQYLGSHSCQIVQITAQGAFYRELNGVGMQEESVCAVVIRKAYISHYQLVAILDEGMTHSLTNS